MLNSQIFASTNVNALAPVKELFPDLFTHSLSKEAWISNLIVSASVGGSRSWNFQFRAPEDWEQDNV